MAMGTRKIGPAIAAGCTMVLKPAALTPLSSLALAQILIDAGLPPGVLNVITTSSSGATTAPLIADPRLRKLSFTGSTEVGKRLIAASAEQVLRVSMELGGNAPFLVFADADLDAAVEGAMLAKMRNGGEACTSANRFHVEQPRGRGVRRPGWRSGWARSSGSGHRGGRRRRTAHRRGPAQQGASLVDDAVAKGARVLCGGGAPGGPGYFFEPTVLSPVPDDADLLREEIFGPVAPIVTFETEQEAVAAANATEYGLVAYVYTSGLDRAVRVAEGIKAGMVGLNQGVVSNPAAPFGGVKQSGFGREGGREGIEEYLDVKYVALRTP